MTVVLAGRAPATFEIKSANLPLVALLLKSADLSLLGRDLAARFGDSPDFFDHDPLVIDLSPLQGADGADIDFASLLRLLRQYRVMPVAACGGNTAQMRGALQAGLAAAPEVAASPSAGSRRLEAVAAPAPAPQPVAAVSPPAAEAERIPPGALLVDRPLRSGQQVYARNRDLVVMSMVNPGAEVIADGHIHVYAPLRGKAIAGARGNTQARIFSLSLEAELVSIAGVYRTSEVPLPAELQFQPTQVRLDGGVGDGRLVIEALH